MRMAVRPDPAPPAAILDLLLIVTQAVVIGRIMQIGRGVTTAWRPMSDPAIMSLMTAAGPHAQPHASHAHETKSTWAVASV